MIYTRTHGAFAIRDRAFRSEVETKRFGELCERHIAERR